MTDEAYIKVHIEIPPVKHPALIAVLSDIDYYAFEEHPASIDAYILDKDFSEVKLKQTVDAYFPDVYLNRKVEKILPKDWNAEWEKNFESTFVEDFCEIHPPFREPTGSTRHQIVVNPKMAFGTGQHSTTWLMVRHAADLDFEGKKVLDMGCGTGVLGILAARLGAAEVTLIDIDDWCTENAAENADLNGLEGLKIIRGGSEVIPAEDCYDIILANINRNILMADRDKYIRHLKVGGRIVLSGIYDFDEEKLTNHYLEAGLLLKDRAKRKEWVRLAFEKLSTSGKEHCL